MTLRDFLSACQCNQELFSTSQCESSLRLVKISGTTGKSIQMKRHGEIGQIRKHIARYFTEKADGFDEGATARFVGKLLAKGGMGSA